MPFRLSFAALLPRPPPAAAACLPPPANPQFPAAHVHPHALPASGGASGVADSVVQFANAAHAAMVVVGSRGMGAVKRCALRHAGRPSKLCL